MLLTLLLVNTTALVGVLLAARYSVTLETSPGNVDGDDWHERVVPRAPRPRSAASSTR